MYSVSVCNYISDKICVCQSCYHCV